jgi:hypothetical protein
MYFRSGLESDCNRDSSCYKAQGPGGQCRGPGKSPQGAPERVPEKKQTKKVKEGAICDFVS